MILLYANLHEVRYVDYKPRHCIGYQAKYLSRGMIQYCDGVILFGCSGYTGTEKIAWDKLYKPKTYPFVEHHIDEYWIETYRRAGHDFVDMESYHVKKLCKELNVPFESVRYIVDRCGKRCVPWGINHFWLKYQHRRMQLKFNEYLREL